MVNDGKQDKRNINSMKEFSIAHMQGWSTGKADKECKDRKMLSQLEITRLAILLDMNIEEFHKGYAVGYGGKDADERKWWDAIIEAAIKNHI